MASDDRLTIPKLTMEVLKQREEKNLTGAILEVTISPAGRSNDALPPESAETKLLGKIKDIRKNLGRMLSLSTLNFKYIQLMNNSVSEYN